MIKIGLDKVTFQFHSFNEVDPCAAEPDALLIEAAEVLKALEEQAPEVMEEWGKTCWKDGYSAALKDGGMTDWMEIPK